MTSTVTKIRLDYDEWHEDLNFHGVYHKPVWSTVWTSGSVSTEPEINAPIVCLVCGKQR